MNEMYDMRCRIHRLEDKFLRSKDFQEQLRLNSVLRIYRKQLQKIIWEDRRKGVMV